MKSMQNAMEIAKKIAVQEEHTILEQMSDLVRRGLLVIEKQQATLVQDRTEIGYMLRILPNIKLKLKDQEYIEKLEKENEELKTRMNAIEVAVKGLV